MLNRRWLIVAIFSGSSSSAVFMAAVFYACQIIGVRSQSYLRSVHYHLVLA